MRASTLRGNVLAVLSAAVEDGWLPGNPAARQGRAGRHRPPIGYTSGDDAVEHGAALLVSSENGSHGAVAGAFTRRRTLLTALLAVASAGPAGADTLTVTDCGDTTSGGAPGQLRRLITDAAPGDTIVVPACTITLTGAANEDLNAGGDLDIRTDVTIRGAGAGSTIIDGGGIDRVFDVLVGITAVLSDLTIQNGGNLATTGGGGVLNAGSLTLERVTVRSNTAGTNNAGGGIANSGSGSLAGTELTIQDNSAAFGGGLFNGTMASVALANSTISGNVAAGFVLSVFGDGGGIDNQGTAALTNVTISGNSSYRGSGIFNFNAGTMTLASVTLSGNFAQRLS